MLPTLLSESFPGGLLSLNCNQIPPSSDYTYSNLNPAIRCSGTTPCTSPSDPMCPSCARHMIVMCPSSIGPRRPLPPSKLENLVACNIMPKIYCCQGFRVLDLQRSKCCIGNSQPLSPLTHVTPIAARPHIMPLHYHHIPSPCPPILYPSSPPESLGLPPGCQYSANPKRLLGLKFRQLNE